MGSVIFHAVFDLALRALIGALESKETRATVSRLSREATDHVVTRLKEHRQFKMSVQR